MSILIAWLGQRDLDAAMSCPHQNSVPSQGPVADFLASRPHQHVVLLNPNGLTAARYKNWLQHRCPIPVTLVEAPLTAPHDFDAVYQATRQYVTRALQICADHNEASPAYLVTSGPGTTTTAAMASALLVVACCDIAGPVYQANISTSGANRRPSFTRLRWPERLSLAAVASQSLLGRDAATATATWPLQSADPAMNQIYARAEFLASTSLPVLLGGESGSGQDVLASAIARAGCHQLVIKLDGAVTAPHDLERAESAATVIIERVGELSAPAQAALHRRLRTNTPRIVATCEGDLRARVAAGEFRPDVYLGLATYYLQLLPLRRRHGEIRRLGSEMLAHDNAARNAARNASTELTPAAWQTLEQYDWPGNLVEFRNVFGRCLLDAVGGEDQRLVSQTTVKDVLAAQGLLPKTLSPTTLSPNSSLSPGAQIVQQVRDTGWSLQDTLERLEAAALREAIAQEGTQKNAGRLLGYSPQNLSNTKRRLQDKGFWD